MSDTQDATAAKAEGAKAGAKGAAPDPMSIPIDDLRRQLNADPENSRLGEPPTAVPDPVEDVVEAEETAAEKTAAAKEVDEIKQAVTEESEEETPAAEAAEVNPDLELLQRQLSKLERKLSSREGKYGSQQQRIEALERENVELRRSRDGDDGLDESAERRREPSPRSDPNTPFLLRQAQDNAIVAFLQAHPDVVTKDGKMEASFEAHARNETKGSLPKTPAELQTELASRLDDAYDNFKIDKIKAERQAKRGEQAESLKKNKRTAALSASGGKPPRTKPKTFDPHTVPIEELRKQVEKRYAEGG